MGSDSERWDGYVDWRNRPALRGKHGGMLAASFVSVVEVIESMAFLSIASNFASYLVKHMNFELTEAANTVSNFCGTSFFLALVSGFLCDTYFTAYRVCLVSVSIMLTGFVILDIQAGSPALMPEPCVTATDGSKKCARITGAEAAMLFAGLYLVAVGEGGIKGSLPVQGAEQFDEETAEGRSKRSTFFNCFVFSLSFGVLLATTVIAWIEDHKGWYMGLMVVAFAVFSAIPVFLAGSVFYRNRIAIGSPLTTIAKVILASLLNTSSRSTSPTTGNSDSTSNDDDGEMKPMSKSPMDQEQQELESCKKKSSYYLTEDLKFLNRACNKNPIFHSSLTCTAEEVSAVKAVVHLLPIFFSTVPISFSITELGGFGLQQAMTMDTTLFSFRLSPAVFTAFPVIFIMLVAPLYDRFFVPIARRITSIETGITYLQRMGVGLVLSVIAPVVAATTEIRRRKMAWESGPANKMSFLWVALQMLILGSADLFTLAGMLDMFFTEMPGKMRSLAMSMSWASMALGNFAGVVTVTAVNAATRREGGGGGWLEGEDLDHFKLERFYLLIGGINVVNLGHYLYRARRYEYRSSGQHRRREGSPL